MLGLKEIPAIVRAIRDSDALEMALIENIQRENLNPIEEASAYERLIKEYAFTQETLSRKVGKNRSSIANFLRLLKLPGKIKDDLADNRLTMGHARAHLAIDSEAGQLELRDRIIQSGMNVREVEDKARSGKVSNKRKKPPANIFLEKVRLGLERKLAAKVGIKPKPSGAGGQIQLHYSDDEDLDRIIHLIG